MVTMEQMHSLSKAHLTNMNLNKITMIEACVLHWGHLEWLYLRTKFHENLPNGLKVISGGHRQTGREAVWWFDKPTFIFEK
jgi:hypothetical protein